MRMRTFVPALSMAVPCALQGRLDPATANNNADPGINLVRQLDRAEFA